MWNTFIVGILVLATLSQNVFGDVSELKGYQKYKPEKPFDIPTSGSGSSSSISEYPGDSFPAGATGSEVQTNLPILAALRFLACGGYQVGVGNDIHLAISQSSVSRCVSEVCYAINNNLFNDWVHFPNDVNELNSVRMGFYRKYGFPGTIGALDCTHVAIFPPSINNEENIYVNRKGYHSINVQLKHHNEQHHDSHHHHHHGEDGKYNPHDDGTGWDIRKSVPGEPGRDYPTYDSVPSTSFSCSTKSPGYYADEETRCQVFRICTTGSVNAFNSFLCPNGSLFNQAVLTCDWWNNVDCQASSKFYDRNPSTMPHGAELMREITKMLNAPMKQLFTSQHTKFETNIGDNQIQGTGDIPDLYLPPKQVQTQFKSSAKTDYNKNTNFDSRTSTSMNKPSVEYELPKTSEVSNVKTTYNPPKINTPQVGDKSQSSSKNSNSNRQTTIPLLHVLTTPISTTSNTEQTLFTSSSPNSIKENDKPLFTSQLPPAKPTQNISTNRNSNQSQENQLFLSSLPTNKPDNMTSGLPLFLSTELSSSNQQSNNNNNQLILSQTNSKDQNQQHLFLSQTSTTKPKNSNMFTTQKNPKIQPIFMSNSGILSNNGNNQQGQPFLSQTAPQNTLFVSQKTEKPQPVFLSSTNASSSNNENHLFTSQVAGSKQNQREPQNTLFISSENTKTDNKNEQLFTSPSPNQIAKPNQPLFLSTQSQSQNHNNNKLFTSPSSQQTSQESKTDNMLFTSKIMPLSRPPSMSTNSQSSNNKNMKLFTFQVANSERQINTDSMLYTSQEKPIMPPLSLSLNSQSFNKEFNNLFTSNLMNTTDNKVFTSKIIPHAPVAPKPSPPIIKNKSKDQNFVSQIQQTPTVGQDYQYPKPGVTVTKEQTHTVTHSEKTTKTYHGGDQTQQGGHTDYTHTQNVGQSNVHQQQQPQNGFGHFGSQHHQQSQNNFGHFGSQQNVQEKDHQHVGGQSQSNIHHQQHQNDFNTQRNQFGSQGTTQQQSSFQKFEGQNQNNQHAGVSQTSSQHVTQSGLQHSGVKQQNDILSSVPALHSLTGGSIKASDIGIAELSKEQAIHKINNIQSEIQQSTQKTDSRLGQGKLDIRINEQGLPVNNQGQFGSFGQTSQQQQSVPLSLSNQQNVQPTQTFQNQGFHNHGVQNQGFHNHEVQNQGFHNQGIQDQGFQNQGIQDQGFQNQGFQSHNVQNSFSTQNVNPNYFEQNLQNYNYHEKNNNQNGHNFEVFRNGANHNYKGETLQVHAGGQTHSSYSGKNLAYKEVTKVEIIPAIGFEISELNDQNNFKTAILNGLIQDQPNFQGLPSTGSSTSALLPTDVRYSSYQGPSSYLAPQASVQRLPSDSGYAGYHR